MLAPKVFGDFNDDLNVIFDCAEFSVGSSLSLMLRPYRFEGLKLIFDGREAGGKRGGGFILRWNMFF